MVEGSDMALSGSTLEGLIKSNLEAPLQAEIKSKLQTFFTIQPDADSQAWFNNFCEKLGSAIANKVAEHVGNQVVTHIKAEAVVNSTGTVTSGSGSGGSVTAVGSIT